MARITRLTARVRCITLKKTLMCWLKVKTKLQVPMTYTDAAGNTFTKTFVLKRGDYAVNVNYNVQNAGEKPLEISSFGQLKQSITLPPHLDTGSSNFALHTFPWRGVLHA